MATIIFMQIWVSKDGRQWVTVLDYSRLKCYSVQRLFFTKMAIRSDVCISSIVSLYYTCIPCSHPLVLEDLLDVVRHCYPMYMHRYVRILQTRGKEKFTVHLDSCSYVGPVPYKFRDLGLIGTVTVHVSHVC